MAHEVDLMDTTEVAAYLGLTTGRVRQLAIDGLLKGQRLGGKQRGAWAFVRDDVEEFKRRRRRPGRPSKVQ